MSEDGAEFVSTNPDLIKDTLKVVAQPPSPDFEKYAKLGEPLLTDQRGNFGSYFSSLAAKELVEDGVFDEDYLLEDYDYPMYYTATIEKDSGKKIYDGINAFAKQSPDVYKDLLSYYKAIKVGRGTFRQPGIPEKYKAQIIEARGQSIDGEGPLNSDSFKKWEKLVPAVEASACREVSKLSGIDEATLRH